MKKDLEWSGLLKLPPEAIIKELRVTLGKQTSYIQELEDKLKEKEIKNIKQTKLQHLENEVINATKKLKDAENRLGDAIKRNKVLESELFRLLKQQNEKTT